MEFALRWLDCHLALSSRLGKPLLLSEFGKRDGTDGHRPAFYQTLLATALARMHTGSPLAGTLFWMIAAPSYPDYDEFTIYFRGKGGGDSQQDPTADVIKQHAAGVAALNAAA